MIGGGCLAKLEIDRFGCNVSSDVGFFGIGGADGSRFSSVDVRNNGFFDVEPAKLFRRLGVADLLSGSDNCRMCRINSGGSGGGGSGSLAIGLSSSTAVGGGGGSSGLGTRSAGFFGGLSGTQSSSEIIGPIIIGPSRSF